MKKKALNAFVHFIAYYVAWVACIYYAARNDAWLGPAIALLCILFQIIWQKAHGHPVRAAIIYSVALTAVGVISDSLWMHLHQLDFQANPLTPYISAPWMMCLWLSFGFNIMITYTKTLNYYFIWGLLAGTGVPFAYWLGVVAGAATTSTPLSFYVILGLFWFAALPLSFMVYHRFIPNEVTA